MAMDAVGKINIVKRGDIPSLTGLRGVAAWLVVIAHTDGYYDKLQPAGLEYAWRTCSNLGMMLFFVLSGFVIHYNYGASLSTRRPSALRAFAVARFARLYPLYVFAFMIEVAVVGPGLFSTSTFWQVLPYYATLTQNWTMQTFNGVLMTSLYVGLAWSISVEVFLYVFYLAAIVPISSLRNWRSTLTAIAVLVVAATIFFGGYGTGYWFSTLPTQQWWLDLSPYCRVPEFLLGVLCADLHLKLKEPPGIRETRAARLLPLLGLGWVALVFLLCYRYYYIQASWGFAPGLAALMFYFARYKGGLSRIVESKVAIAIGDASYSIYLLHGWVLHLLNQGSYPSIAFAVFRIAISWVVIVLLSLGVYRYFESPARRFVRSWLLTPPTKVLATTRVDAGASEKAVPAGHYPAA